MKIIFEAIVGSQAYGTNVEGSDIDIKGVYIQPIEEVAAFGYKPQIEPDKDTTYYEVRRFLELASKGNPTVLELLFSPEDCIKICTDEFKLIQKHKDLFITKKCFSAFAGYANEQIIKAKGLNKKMNWEKERIVRKTISDFCYVASNAKSLKLSDWLKLKDYDINYIGLVGLDHMADCYGIYYDNVAKWADAKTSSTPRGEEVPRLGFKGVECKNGDNLVTSNVPKYVPAEPETLYFNKSLYKAHCKEFREYKEWEENHNKQRYVDVENHGQKIDGKNLLHCRRLIDVAKEIATTGSFTVRRPNADYLKSIRQGKIPLEKLIGDSKEDLDNLKGLFEASNLPEQCDFEKVEQLLKELRKH